MKDIIKSQFKVEFGGRSVAVTVGALLTIFLARLLKPNEYGLLFLAMSIFGVAQLFSKWGVASSAAKYISEYKEKAPGQIKNILKYSIFLNIITICVACVLFYLSIDIIVSVINEPGIKPLLEFGVIFIIFRTLVKLLRKIFQAFSQIRISTFIHLTDRVSQFIFVIGLSFLGYGALGALAGYIMSALITSLIGMGLMYFVNYKGKESTQVEDGLYKKITEYTFPVTLTGSANIIDKRVDTILVGIFVGPVGVAYYTIGKRVVEFIQTPMASLGFVLSPLYMSEKEKGNVEEIGEIYVKSINISLLLYVPGAAGLILVSDSMVRLVFGTDYMGSIIIIQILSIYAILRALSNLTSNGLDYLGRARERAKIKGLTSVANFFLNILLIPLMGVSGAAVATVITYSVYTLYNIAIFNTEIPISIDKLLRGLGIAIVVSLLMSGGVFSFQMISTGLFEFVGSVLIGLVIWVMICSKLEYFNLWNLAVRQ